MGHVRGFDQQILEALENPDPGIHYHAVRAAGTWEVEAAWPHVAALARSDTNKPLRLAAIEALGTLCPLDSVEVLANLADSEDEDVAETASEAMTMAEGMSDDEDDDEFAEDEDDEDDDFADDEDEDDDEEPGSGNHESIH
jgi:HEAT repeat protein